MVWIVDVSSNCCAGDVKTKERGNVKNWERKVYRMTTKTTSTTTTQTTTLAGDFNVCLLHTSYICTYVIQTFKFQWIAFSNELKPNEKIQLACVSLLFIYLCFFLLYKLCTLHAMSILPYIYRGKKIATAREVEEKYISNDKKTHRE